MRPLSLSCKWDKAREARVNRSYDSPDLVGVKPQVDPYPHPPAGQEMWVLMPAGAAFSLVAWLVVGWRPATVQPFALAQLAFTLAFVAGFVRSFAERQRLITACVQEG